MCSPCYPNVLHKVVSSNTCCIEEAVCTLPAWQAGQVHEVLVVDEWPDHNVQPCTV